MSTRSTATSTALGGEFTRNPPLFVNRGSTLTACVRLQRTAELPRRLGLPTEELPGEVPGHPTERGQRPIGLPGPDAARYAQLCGRGRREGAGKPHPRRVGGRLPLGLRTDLGECR